ncbi:MAG: hypothetical protein F4011_00050 [Acidimicrobiaceae bacterium]|nr:hypothetical protein [Acidimicrobiaceae bacterium]MYG98429.1 hypothetical protein [Acidimicrobiaceae bacterium]MYL02560.1 hypothetical protein [Acidimicrobiaceae bacterium]
MTRRAIRRTIEFVRVLFQKPPENAAMKEVKAAASRVQGAIHARGDASASFHSGGRSADGFFGQEIAGGHEKARKKAPPPRAR